MQLNSGPLLLAAGAVASCGAFLALAGAGKIYRWLQVRHGTHLADDDDVAIRRALRLPRRAWRMLVPVIGCLEIAAGAAVCAGRSGRYPVAGGVAMAVLGAGFAGLLGYTRLRRIPGGCGCNSWRSRPEPVSWRSVARAGMISCAGLAELTWPTKLTWPSDASTAPASLSWYAGGVLAGAVILLLASADLPVRTVPCGRPVLFPVRRRLRALTGHGVFAAMAESAGPFGTAIRHRRTQCADEFWFTSNAGPVTFQVEHAGPGGALAVLTSIGGTAPDGVAAADSGAGSAGMPGRLMRTSWPPRRADRWLPALSRP
jgi:hypothetical protein